MSKGTENQVKYYENVGKQEYKEKFAKMIELAVRLEKHKEEKKLLNPMYFDIYGQGRLSAMYHDKELVKLLNETVQAYCDFMNWTEGNLEQREQGVHFLTRYGFKGHNKEEFINNLSVYTNEIIEMFLLDVFGVYVRTNNAVNELGELLQYIEEEVGENRTNEGYINVITEYINNGYKSLEGKKYNAKTERHRAMKLGRVLTLNMNGRNWYGSTYITPYLMTGENEKYESYGKYLYNHMEALQEIYKELRKEMDEYQAVYVGTKRRIFEDDNDFHGLLIGEYNKSVLGTGLVDVRGLKYLSEVEQEIVRYGYVVGEKLQTKYTGNVMITETEIQEIKKKFDLMCSIVDGRVDVTNEVNEYLPYANRLTIESKVMLLHHQVLMQIGELLSYNYRATKGFYKYMVKFGRIFKNSRRPNQPTLNVEHYTEKLKKYHHNYQKGIEEYKESMEDLIEELNRYQRG